MNERNKGILLAALVVLAALRVVLRAFQRLRGVCVGADGEMSYRPLAVENPALQRDKQRAQPENRVQGHGPRSVQ